MAVEARGAAVTKPRRNSAGSVFNWIMPAAAVWIFLPILAYAGLGFYARYLADDFHTAQVLDSLGFIEFQKYWYTAWSGRFSFFFFVALAELVGPQIVPFLPVAALVCLVGGTAWSIFAALRQAKEEVPAGAALLLSGIIVYAAFDSIPNILQSLYWQTGMLTYVAPIILFVVYLAFLLHQAGKKPPKTGAPVLFLSGFLPFLGGGFSETAVAVQTAILLLGFVFCLTGQPGSARRKVLGLVTAGLIGSIAAMIVVAAAPGNQIRQADYLAPPGLVTLLKRSIKETLKFTYRSAASHPFQLIFSLVFPVFAAFGYSPRGQEAGSTGLQKSLALILIPVVTFLLILACFVPAFYGMSARPPDRVLIIPQFVLTYLVVVWSFFAGKALRRMASPDRLGAVFTRVIIAVILLAVIFLGPVASTRKILAQYPAYQNFAEEWDRRDRHLKEARQQGAEQAAAWSLPLDTGLADITSDPDNWWNQAIAWYYGLESVVIK